MWRNLASNVLTLLMVGLFLLAGLILFGQAQYRASGPLQEAICFQVRSGSNFSEVSASLADQNAINSPSLFRLGVDYAGKDGDLKAGNFLIEPGASMETIVDQVTRGGASTCGSEIIYRIGVTRLIIDVREMDPSTTDFEERASFTPAEDAIPAAYNEFKAAPDTRFRIAMAEGVTSWQVVDALSRMDILTGEPGERPAEGLLAPDSYEVTPGTTRLSLLEEMQARQQTRLTDAWLTREDGLPISSPMELLTLASIIEKETAVAEERGQVASVFVNRLNQGIRLQTDPTVIYGITRGQGTLGRGIRQSELRRETPWNTYVIDGLPPTPIANPGLAALEAAANPDETAYIFFVADGTGGHAFAETLAEHNRNVAAWREIERSRVRSLTDDN